MLHHFSDLCKYFTKAKTLKYQLYMQEHLFNNDSAQLHDHGRHNIISTIL